MMAVVSGAYVREILDGFRISTQGFCFTDGDRVLTTLEIPSIPEGNTVNISLPDTFQGRIEVVLC
jgi:hypothetical protein